MLRAAHGGDEETLVNLLEEGDVPIDVSNTVLIYKL